MAEQLELFPELEPTQQGSVAIEEAKPIEDAEWCFQFFNNEPIVFAYSNEGEKADVLTLSVRPEEGQGLTFQQNGMLFKIFPREISEETKLERAKSKENDVR
jgi:hypothetical protein